MFFFFFVVHCGRAVQLSASVALADAVSEAVVHQPGGGPAGLQDPAHALGGRDGLLPRKGT